MLCASRPAPGLGVAGDHAGEGHRRGPLASIAVVPHLLPRHIEGQLFRGERLDVIEVVGGARLDVRLVALPERQHLRRGPLLGGRGGDVLRRIAKLRSKSARLRIADPVLVFGG